MSANRIALILEDLEASRGVNITDFAEMCGVKRHTLYKIRDKDTLDNVTISVFLKIAHALGMTAEELYYGEEKPRGYADPREAELHRVWGVLDEGRRDRLVETAQDMEIAKGRGGASLSGQRAG